MRYVITHVNGRKIGSNADLAAALAKNAPGTEIVLGYLFKSNLGWMGMETLVTLADESSPREESPK
jgi:S1-C subfamily serine protease